MKKQKTKTVKGEEKYTVRSRFSFKNDDHVYDIDEDVSHLPSVRLSELVKRGIVKKS